MKIEKWGRKIATKIGTFYILHVKQKVKFFLIYKLQYVMTSSNFGLHESLNNNHRFRHLPFRRTSQLIVTFIRPVINFNKGLSFLIQLLESKERP